MQVKTKRGRFTTKSFDVVVDDDSKTLIDLILENNNTKELHKGFLLVQHHDSAYFRTGMFRSRGYAVAQRVAREFISEIISKLESNENFSFNELKEEYSSKNEKEASKERRDPTTMSIHLEVQNRSINTLS